MTASALLRRPVRALAGALLLAAAAGCADTLAPAPETYAEQFAVFWDAFDRWYPYFDLKHVDWDSVRAKDAAAVETAPSQLYFILQLREAALPLRDGHVWFEDPEGRVLPAYTYPEAAANFGAAALDTAGAWTSRPQLRYARLADGVPYVAVNEWGGGLDMADVAAALEAFRHDGALILDLRHNQGGDDRMAYELAGRFTRERVLAEYYQTRDGPERGDLSAPVARYVEPRGPWTFTGRVALLTGQRTRSASESFVSAMRELPNVRTFGDRTGGASGSPEPVRLGGGWSVYVPRRFYRTADGAPVEWSGIAPDVAVPWAVGPRDPVVEAARAWLTRPAP